MLWVDVLLNISACYAPWLNNFRH